VGFVTTILTLASPASASASAMCAPPDALKTDLDIEVVSPSLVSGYVFGDMTIRPVFHFLLQKVDHQIDSRAREFHLLELHRFHPFFVLFAPPSAPTVTHACADR
jgi:hypothetical protein